MSREEADVTLETLNTKLDALTIMVKAEKSEKSSNKVQDIPELKDVVPWTEIKNIIDLAAKVSNKTMYITS